MPSTLHRASPDLLFIWELPGSFIFLPCWIVVYLLCGFLLAPYSPFLAPESSCNCQWHNLWSFSDVRLKKHTQESYWTAAWEVKTPPSSDLLHLIRHSWETSPCVVLHLKARKERVVWSSKMKLTFELCMEYTSIDIGSDDCLLHRIVRLRIEVWEHDSFNIYLLMYTDESIVRL